MAYTKTEINHSQFYRYETFGRASPKVKEGNEKKGTKKGGKTMFDIGGEADRLEGYTEHLDEIKSPIILYGTTFSEAIKMAEKWCDQNKEIRHDKKKIKKVNQETGKEEEVIEIVERKVALKKTAQCCIAGIISAPPDMSEEDWNNYKKDSVDFLKKKFNSRLKSVVEHNDENYYTENFKEVLHHHLHFFVVPELNEKIEDIHPGLKAKRQADTLWGDRTATAAATKDERSESRKNGDKAYRTAMRKEQDEFYDSVSYKYNLNRKGKKRCQYFTREQFLEWNETRNDNARKQNELNNQHQEQLKKESELLFLQETIESSKKEKEEWENSKTESDEYVKELDEEVKPLPKLEKVSNIGSVEALEENFPTKKTGAFSHENPYEYGNRITKTLWSWFKSKFYDPLKDKCNKLLKVVKDLKQENLLQKNKIERLEIENDRLNKNLDLVVDEKLKEKSVGIIEKAKKEALEPHKNTLLWMETFKKNEKVSLLFSNNETLNLLHGKESIHNMDKELCAFECLTPLGLENLAKKMRNHKFESVDEAYEYMLKKNLKSFTEIPEKPKSNSISMSY